ncbi:MAG: four helix bundle protein [Bacteroidia bacterium]
MRVQDLDVWKAAIDLAAEAYKLADTFPETSSHGLAYHLKASVTHLPSNIAAAASRKYGTESLKYLFKAKGIIYEIESMYYLAEKLDYIGEEERDQHLESLDSAKRLLFGFIKYYKKSS